MVASRILWLGALLLLGTCIACTGSNARGQALYSEGRFIEAAEVFEHNEPHIEQLALEERAVYGLYRGMTFLELGDYENASRWLDYAAANAAHVSSKPLSMTDSERLRLALRRCEQLRIAQGPAPNPLAGAVASTGATAAEHDTSEEILPHSMVTAPPDSQDRRPPTPANP